MGAWHGSQFKGASREMRKIKREEAEERNAATLPENRRQYRRDHASD